MDDEFALSLLQYDYQTLAQHAAGDTGNKQPMRGLLLVGRIVLNRPAFLELIREIHRIADLSGINWREIHA